jgi:hypothetical protein
MNRSRTMSPRLVMPRRTKGLSGQSVQAAIDSEKAAQRLFAGVRFLEANASDTPDIVALCRVAASVRLRAFAILGSGSLRAMLLRRRRSSFDHALRTGAFLVRTATFTTFAPTTFQTNVRSALCMICEALQASRRVRARRQNERSCSNEVSTGDARDCAHHC